MCGRIFIQPSESTNLVLESFGLQGFELPKLNNVAPTEQIPVIHHTGEGIAITNMRWWLHPSWEKEPPHQKQARFNARVETVLTLNSYRAAIKRRRAIVPMEAFVEWQKVGEGKQPWYIQGSDEPLSIAAIWEIWNNNVLSCAIITQPATPSFAPIHDRMPVSLTLEQAHRWIDPSEDAGALIGDFGHASVSLVERRISAAVNNARNKADPVFMEN